MQKDMGYAKRKKKNIYPCLEAWEEKKGGRKRDKRKDSPYLKKKIKGRVVQKGVRVPSRKFHTHACLDLIV